MMATLSPGVHCPKCRSTRLMVKNSRPRDNAIVRRRECKACGERFNSWEFPEHEVPSMERMPRQDIKALKAMALRMIERADASLADE
jgi:transcriptional regulator NrdR family protein